MGRGPADGAGRLLTGVAFAKGGGGAKAAKGSPKGGALADVAGAVAGAGGCGNGTVNGKRGFQPGNKCHAGRNPGVTAKQKAHTAASAVARRHLKSGTALTPQGRAAIKAAAQAGRELKAARETHKAEQKTRYAENAKARRAAAKATASTPAAKSATSAAKVEAKADAALKAAQAEHQVGVPKAVPAPKPKPEPAPKPTAADHVAASAKEALGVKSGKAATHLSDLHAGVKAGAIKAEDAHKHLDRIARGATKDELFAAAKSAGIEHKVTTKKALVEHLKAHASATANPAPKPEAKSGSPGSAAKPEPKPAAKPDPAKAGAATPHAFREAIKKAHGGEIDDRRTTVEQVAAKSGMSKAEVEATVRELGARGALSFDHATPHDVAMAKGVRTFPTDHEGKPYHGFRVDRPAKFEAATKATAAPATAPAVKAKAYTDPTQPTLGVVDANPVHARIGNAERPLHRDNVKALSAPERSVLKEYKQGTVDVGGGKKHDAYHEINQALREGRTHSAVPVLDAALAKSVVPRDTVVYRGIENLPALGFRSGPDAVGSMIHDRAYVSTSLSHHTASQFAGGKYGGEGAAIIRLTLPKGSKAAYVDAVPGANMHENEYLLPRDSRFRVTGYGGRTDKGVHILDAELHHEGGVGFAAEKPDPKPDPKPEGDDRSGRFAWKPGDVTVTRPKGGDK